MGEKGPSNPTRSPRELLGKIAHGAKEVGITLLVAPAPGGIAALGVRRAIMEAEAQRLKTQAAKVIEGPTPERGQQVTTEASKGLLGKVAKEAREIAENIREGARHPFELLPPEAKKPSRPAEVSNSFLKDWSKRLLRPLDIATKFPIGIATEITALSILKNLGGLDAQQYMVDITEGRWGTLVAKGVLAGIAAAPIARLVIESR